MKLEFFVPMIPPTATHQMHKITTRGKTPRIYEPAKVAAARSKLTNHLTCHRPLRPMNGAVQLLVKWCFPRGAHGDGEYRITRPDTDNLQKLLKDVMTDLGFWKEDAQVACEIVEKFWAEIPGLYICACEIGGDADGQD